MPTLDLDGKQAKQDGFRERLLMLLHEYECLEVEHARLKEYLRSNGVSASSALSAGVTSTNHPLELELLPAESPRTDLDSLAFVSGGQHDTDMASKQEACNAIFEDAEAEHVVAEEAASVAEEDASPRPARINRKASFLELKPEYERLQKEHSLRRYAAWLVSHTCFESTVTAVIVANVMYMGWAANEQFKHRDEDESPAMRIIDACFAVMFLIELTLRMLAYGKEFFFNSDWSWNIFDTVLVMQSVMDQVMFLAGWTEGGGNKVSFLRFLRLGKLVKMLRVIRVMRSMREMRLILFSIMGSVKGMLWSVILIVAVLYMFSLVFVLASVEALKAGDIQPGSQAESDIFEYWSSVEAGMLSLFLSSSGGKDWAEVADVVLEIGSVYFACFCFYIAFYLCVLMNTITALFVETTFTTASKDLQYTIASVMENKAEYVSKLKVLFQQLDENGDGLISDEAFCSKLNDPEMRAFAESLEIEISDAKSFFRILTDDGRKSVDLDTFVDACIKMRGQALSVDMHDLIKQNRVSQEEIQTQLRALEKEVANLGHLPSAFLAAWTKLADRAINQPRQSFSINSELGPLACDRADTGVSRADTAVSVAERSISRRSLTNSSEPDSLPRSDAAVGFAERMLSQQALPCELPKLPGDTADVAVWPSLAL